MRRGFTSGLPFSGVRTSKMANEVVGDVEDMETDMSPERKFWHCAASCFIAPIRNQGLKLGTY